MIGILVLFSYLLVILNLGAPLKISNASVIQLIVEHSAVLIVSFLIVRTILKSKGIVLRFYTFFLLSYCFSLLFLYFEWTPSLVKNYATDWSTFDPIKYYCIALESIKYSFMDQDVRNFPIIYIYYVIMCVFGADPLVPLFVNELVFVYAVCIIARFMGANDFSHIQHYCWLFLIPEIVAYNTTASKDIVCMICASVLCVKAAEIFKVGISVRRILIILITIGVFAIARTSLALCSMVAIGVQMFLSPKRNLKLVVPCLVFFFILCMALVLIQGDLGNSEQISDKVSAELAGDMSKSYVLEDQSASSFARYLVPHSTFQFVVYGFIRSLCYIVIDPRFILHPFDTLVPLSGITLLTLVDYTTFFMFCFLIFIVIWLKKKCKYRDTNVKNVLYVTLIYWFSVGAFNPLMIHVRYRVVYDLLFFTLAIYAYHVTRNKKNVMMDN